ncbi:hypothetical protein PENTCL1PPCAC_26974, partial [Pristionchus entomophagus]
RCTDFTCIEKYYEPLYTFFTVYARHYEGRDDRGKRALQALEYMNRFKKPSMFYNILLERVYMHKYRLVGLEDFLKNNQFRRLKKTAAGVPQTDLLGLTYIDILKEEWNKTKAPEDDNVEEAIEFYRKEYKKGNELWKWFGNETAKILAHTSALHAINTQYPKDILDLVSSDPNFDNARFMRVIQKDDRLVLPESYLVESVYRTNDTNV